MVYLVRHGQTAWNTDGLFRGHHDVPLSDEGRKQADRAAAYLTDCKISLIFTSPLSRSRETASIIADRIGCSVHVQQGLTDVDFGQWEGKTSRDVASRYPDSYFLYKNHPERAAFPEGETLSGCFERAVGSFFRILGGVASALESAEGDVGVASEHQYPANIAIVTHRVILKLIVLGILGLSPAQFWKIHLDTCSISELVYEHGHCILRKLNSTCHLLGSGNHVNDF